MFIVKDLKCRVIHEWVWKNACTAFWLSTLNLFIQTWRGVLLLTLCVYPFVQRSDAYPWHSCNVWKQCLLKLITSLTSLIDWFNYDHVIYYVIASLLRLIYCLKSALMRKSKRFFGYIRRSFVSMVIPRKSLKGYTCRL